MTGPSLYVGPSAGFDQGFNFEMGRIAAGLTFVIGMLLVVGVVAGCVLLVDRWRTRLK